MVLEGPGGGRDGGAPFCVKIDLTVPGAHIHADSLHADGRVTKTSIWPCRDAFNNAKGQLGLIAIASSTRQPDRAVFAAPRGCQIDSR